MTHLKISIAAVCLTIASIATAQERPIRRVSQPEANHYIVVLAGSDDPLAVGLETQAIHRGRLHHVYERVLRGFAIEMPPEAAAIMARDPRVRYVEEDGRVNATDLQASPPWGLDRIDQRALPLDSLYSYPSSAATVYVHVIDTGIRPTHAEFGGRASIAGDFVGDGQNGLDCNGHGTHVAGTIGGATYGVAKSAMLIAHRVLDCSGSGLTSGVIAGVDQVTNDARRPAVANMSLGGSVSTSLDTAVRNSIASGVTYVIAAGNSNANASLSSPARVAEAITVAASTSADARASFSNFGATVDLFAPGVSVLSAWATSDTATNVLSGTSMAAPHVAGVAALYLQAFGSQTPATVAGAITSNATTSVITDPAGSPNRLLYSGFLLTPPAPATLTANPSSITSGQSSTLTLTTPTTNYHGVRINGVFPTTYSCSTTCTMTLVVSPTQTTTYQSSANDSTGTPYPNMPSVTVTVTSPPPPPPGGATLTANPSSITTGQSSTLTLTTPTTDYHNVRINGVRPSTFSCTTTCTMTLVVSPTQTTTYQATASNAAGVPYANMPSVTVTVTGAPPPPPGNATLTANPSSITLGQSSTLTLTTPTANYHNVRINGMTPTSFNCTTTCTITLVVSPTQTTTYQATASNAAGTPYANMPSVVVTVQ
jgi:hypothetical protein